METSIENIMARATLKAPPAMQSQDGDSRVHLVLKPTDNGRYRWYREDGTPTVVDGSTIEGARRTAMLAWRNWEVEIDAAHAVT